MAAAAAALTKRRWQRRDVWGVGALAARFQPQRLAAALPGASLAPTTVAALRWGRLLGGGVDLRHLKLLFYMYVNNYNHMNINYKFIEYITGHSFLLLPR